MAETIRRPRSAFDLRGISALAIYFALAALFFGRGVCARSTTAYIGKGGDPPQLMWLMAWWPHALTHGLNPLFTDAIWAPHGLNLAWATSLPLASLIAALPIAIAGPVAVYNLLGLLALALAAWTAFVLCRYLTGAYCASLTGGYVFGFFPYLLRQTLPPPNLLPVFSVPPFPFLLICGFLAGISWRGVIAGFLLLLPPPPFCLFL